MILGTIMKYRPMLSYFILLSFMDKDITILIQLFKILNTVAKNVCVKKLTSTFLYFRFSTIEKGLKRKAIV